MNRFFICGLAAVLASAGCSPANRTSRSSESGAADRGGLSLDKVVMALKPDKDPDQMLEEKKALEAFLAGELGRPVEVIIPLASSVIMEGLVNGSVDLGYLSATEMITAREKGSSHLLLAGEIEGKTGYQSYWVTLKEKPYQSVADLRGKPVAFASRTSTSGYLVPHWDLIKKGLLPEKADPEAFFGKGNVHYGSGYVSAIERVLNGDVEAAAVSYYVLDKDKHLSLSQRDRLRKVTEQGPVPTHVIAIRSTIPQADREILKSALLSLNQPDWHGLRDKVFTSKLIEVDEQSHLSPLREALVLTGKISP